MPRPKPWQVRLGKPPAKWPFRTPEQQAAFDEWLSTYEAACAEHATCELVGTVGAEAVHPRIQPIMDVHDDMTRVAADLPLA